MDKGKKSRKDLYDILGLDINANKSEIKKAYRNLAKRNHPDINKKDPNANKKFIEIQEAYDELLKKKEEHQIFRSKKNKNIPKNNFFSEFFSKSNVRFQSTSFFNRNETFDTPSKFVNLKEDIRRKRKQKNFKRNPFESFDRKFQELIKRFFEEF